MSANPHGPDPLAFLRAIENACASARTETARLETENAALRAEVERLGKANNDQCDVIAEMQVRIDELEARQ